MLIVLEIIWSQNDETGVLEVQTFKGFLYVSVDFTFCWWHPYKFLFFKKKQKHKSLNFFF